MTAYEMRSSDWSSDVCSSDLFTEPMRVLGTDLVATASIGIALSHDGGQEAAPALLRDADAAMYRAKSRGRARYELFYDALRDWASERLRIESELRHALAHDALGLPSPERTDVVSGTRLSLSVAPGAGPH